MQSFQDEFSDGIYFDMPEDVYHAIPAISSGFIKNILISPVDAYARCEWLNKKAADEDDVTDSDAKIIGRAYHKRVCEGKELFYQQYAPLFQRGKLAEKTDELRAELRKRGLNTEGTKNSLIMRCAKSGIATAATSHAEYIAENDGKIFLRPEIMDSIETSAAMIELNPKLARCFQGGYPEVTVIWTEKMQIERPPTDEEYEASLNEDLLDVIGEQKTPTREILIRYKIRIDYLKVRALIDLKTFENRAMKAVKKAITSTIAAYKYHIQAVLYMRGVEIAKQMIQAGLIFYRGKPLINSEVCNAIDNFCTRLIQTEEHDFYWVFQQKGIAQFARGFKFPRRTMYSVGAVQIDSAVQIYRENAEHFGDLRWVDLCDIETLEDEDFPPWASTDL